MSAELIKENISRILNERGWKLADLEKKAGTNRNINNIFRNKSKPSLELIQRIVETLNIGYKELLEEYHESNYIKNPELFLETCQKVLDKLKTLPPSIKISYEAVFTLVIEVYSYAEQFKNSKIDDEFIKWTIMKYYSLDKL